MLISLECPSCLTTLKVDDSFAGRRGTCKNCGQKVTIPGLNGQSAQPPHVSLAEATPQQMVAEMARRKVSAILAYSDPVSTENPTAATGGDLLESTGKLRRVLHCLKTADLGPEQVSRMLSNLSDQVKREQAVRVAAAGLGERGDLFELKGDWLGMSLDEFKKKYHRELPQIGRTMPWCSDESPGATIPDLSAEPWHAAAGIVTARVDLPAENNSPTIAHEQTEAVIYQFLDGKLFQIEAYFGTPAFHRILGSLMRKFGQPVSESHTPREVVWWSMSATIELKFGSIRPPRPSRLRFYHDDLLQLALSRIPSHSQDI